MNLVIATQLDPETSDYQVRLLLNDWVHRHLDKEAEALWQLRATGLLAVCEGRGSADDELRFASDAWAVVLLTSQTPVAGAWGRGRVVWAGLARNLTALLQWRCFIGKAWNDPPKLGQAVRFWLTEGGVNWTWEPAE